MAKKAATKKKTTKKKAAKKKTSKKTAKKKTGISKAVVAARKKAQKNKKVDQKGWRQHLDTSKVQFTDDLKEKFCKEYARCGRMYQAAEKIGKTYECIRSHLKIDPGFAALFQEAKEAYKDRVHRTVEKVAIQGVDKPIIGGKFKDRVVAHERVYATNILAMEMKRVDPAYREKSEVDLNVKSGVLLMPTPMSQEEWLKHYAKPLPDSSEEGEEQKGETFEHGTY